MAIPLLKDGLTRKSAFGYTCNRCLSCCRSKKIQINPYEIARLAKNRGLSTTEFIARHTTGGGTLLRFRKDGSCGFLEAAGCAVHPDRPLVCRLYPLGRTVSFTGEESFSLIERGRGCRGELRETGTVEEYLREQGAFPFMHAADVYLDLLKYLLETLQGQDLGPGQREAVMATVRSVAEAEAGTHDLSWIDMDRAVADYCSRAGLPVPADLEGKMAMHIRAVRDWMA